MTTTTGPQTDRLATEIDGRVATITLTSPEILNSFDEELHSAFTDALRHVLATKEARAIVVASTGKAFSAGGDFEFMKIGHADPTFLAHHVDVGRQLLMAIVECPLPIIAAVQGPAIGLGATVALACDCVVAARTAMIADPHVQIGLVAGDGGCLVWPVAAGMMRAKRYLLTGDRLSAEEAYTFGLVTDLVDTPEEATPAAHALAARIAGLPPLAVQGTKRALVSVMRHRASEVVDVAFAHEQRSAGSDDLLEAIDAFKERRPGVYTGR
jgi:enoyl-CoA hydratase